MHCDVFKMLNRNSFAVVLDSSAISHHHMPHISNKKFEFQIATNSGWQHSDRKNIPTRKREEKTDENPESTNESKTLNIQVTLEIGDFIDVSK